MNLADFVPHIGQWTELLWLTLAAGWLCGAFITKKAAHPSQSSRLRQSELLAIGFYLLFGDPIGTSMLNISRVRDAQSDLRR